MTPDRRSLGLPTFSESATDVPAPTGGDPRLPVGRIEQGADFRQPPGDEVPAPRAARPTPGSGGSLTFSDPDRQI